MEMKDIITPIQDELESTKRVLYETLESEVSLVSDMARYIVALKGKLFRPILVLLSTKACGTIPKPAVKAAAALELIHVATLIHDDVVDGSSMRRGMPTLHTVWSDKASILMGDYMLSKAFSLLVEIGSQMTMDILAKATVRLSSGEIHQIQQSDGMETAEEVYYKVIGDKTASLFSAGCEMGPVFVEGTEHLRGTMAVFGEKVGMAFQITDDILDFEGTEEETGKPTGVDLRGKHLTLPLIHALNVSPKIEAGRIREIIGHELTAEEWSEVRLFITAHGGIDYAARTAGEFARQAKAELIKLDESPAKECLLKVVSHSISRRR